MESAERGMAMTKTKHLLAGSSLILLGLLGITLPSNGYTIAGLCVLAVSLFGLMLLDDLESE